MANARSRGARDREDIRRAPDPGSCATLEAGLVDIVVGTHALITEDVQFRSLGVVVIDEQHRFGVDQRAALREKGSVHEEASHDPDLLVMTATPIPRTAAMTVYGDLDASGPSDGRHRVARRSRPDGSVTRTNTPRGSAFATTSPLVTRRTWSVRSSRLEQTMSMTTGGGDDRGGDRGRLRGGPAIPRARGGCDAASPGEIGDRRGGPPFGEASCGTARRGSPRPAAGATQEEVMIGVPFHEIDVLVATTVIEVGVDVPTRR